MNEAVATRLASVPSPAREALERALRHDNPYATEAFAPLKQALDAVSYPKGLVYPRASDLTKDQRAVVDVLVEDGREVWITGYALPGGAGYLRRWLGVGEQTLLETHEVDGRPLWHALQTASGEGDESLVAVLDTLPIAALLEVMSGIYDAPYLRQTYHDAASLQYLPLRVWRELGAEGAVWAVEQVEKGLRVDWKLAWELRWLVFLALARAKAPIDPRYWSLMPMEGGEFYGPMTREIVKAIPEERRAEVIAAQMAKQQFPSSGVHGALEVIEEVPAAAIVHQVLALMAKSDFPGKSKVLPRLKELGKRHPAIADALKSKVRNEMVLACLSRVTPRSMDALTEIQKKQLAAASRGFDEEGFPPPRILEDGLGELSVIADAKGTPLYEVWWVMGDTGGVFEVGTTKEVGPIIQGAIELADPHLKDAIARALSTKPKVAKTTAKKKTAKKTDARRKTAKKR